MSKYGKGTSTPSEKQMTLTGMKNYQIKACGGYGTVPAKYMFVGISPGRIGAVKTKVPFTKDNSGRLLQKLLYHFGLSLTSDEKTIKPELRDCYLTNLVKCETTDDSRQKNRDPYPTEVDYWLPEFEWEMKIVNPQHTLALGLPVHKALLPLHCKDLHYLHHPSYYANRGALNNTQRWQEMVNEYRTVIRQ